MRHEYRLVLWRVFMLNSWKTWTEGLGALGFSNPRFDDLKACICQASGFTFLVGVLEVLCSAGHVSCNLPYHLFCTCLSCRNLDMFCSTKVLLNDSEHWSHDAVWELRLLCSSAARRQRENVRSTNASHGEESQSESNSLTPLPFRPSLPAPPNSL